MLLTITEIPPLVPAAPPFPHSSVGQIKGKRLKGQARRLTLPDLHILCRMCTVGLWALGNVPHMMIEGSIERFYSAP